MRLTDRTNHGDQRRRGGGYAARLSALGAATGLASSLVLAVPADPFPQVRPASRVQAVTSLSGGMQLPVPCLTPILLSVRGDIVSSAPAARRALRLLQAETHVAGEQRFTEPDGSAAVRYTSERSAFDRIGGGDDDRDGTPDLVESVLAGLREARALFEVRLELPAPPAVDVLLAEVGSSIDGYLVPADGESARPLLVLDSSPSAGTRAMRRSAIHQFAHAAVLHAHPSISAAWSEAIATWAVLELAGPEEASLTEVSGRLKRLAEGLFADDLELAAGNAAWLAYLEEAHGVTAVRLTIEELDSDDPVSTALDRALLRSTGTSLDAGFRDFQLWSLLVGPRDDGRHFSFAPRLAAPSFASKAEGLPALSLHADPAVNPLGASMVLLHTDDTRGGLTVRFEGDAPARWEADLLLVRDGGLHRLPFRLDAYSRGELTVPLQRIHEVVLLVRNLDREGGYPHRFSWAAHHEAGYPVDLASVVVAAAGDGSRLVSWETQSERDLVGYNVLRTRQNGRGATRINPVWIPAVGDDSSPASYQFLDTSAAAGISYAYHIEAITSEGLSSLSEPASTEPIPTP